MKEKEIHNLDQFGGQEEPRLHLFERLNLPPSDIESYTLLPELKNPVQNIQREDTETVWVIFLQSDVQA